MIKKCPQVFTLYCFTVSVTREIPPSTWRPWQLSVLPVSFVSLCSFILWQGTHQVLPFWVRVDLRVMKWRAAWHSPKLQSWSLAIRLFIVVSRTPMSSVLPLYRYAVGVFYSPSRQGWMIGWEYGRNAPLKRIEIQIKKLPSRLEL